MPSKTRVPKLPEPPWSYAPSEVGDWLASTAGGRKGSAAVRGRKARVRGFTGRYPASLEARVVRRLARHGFAPADGARHLVGRNPLHVFQANLAGAKVEVRLRVRDVLEVRVEFRPSMTIPRASQVLSKLGFPPSVGRWR